MAKTKISEYDSTAANNTDVDGVNLAEGCPPSGINNAIREVMAHLKDWQSGVSGDGLSTSGTITSSGTLAVTGGFTLDGAAGTSGQYLTSAGSGNTPTWTTLTGFVSGMIMLWSGSTGTIPSGWALCDGTSGTPDLRDRFVVGAGSTYAVDATGGSADAINVSHTHTLTDSGHTHGAGSYKINTGGDAAQSSTNGAVFRSTITTSTSVTGTSASATTGISIASAGSSGTNANLPPYYALAYIMKT